MATFTNYEGFGTTIAKDFGYSQAVRVGNIIKMAGQGGWDAEGKLSSDVTEQVAQCFANIEANIKAAGGSGLDDIISVRSYHTDLHTGSGAVSKYLKEKLSQSPVWTAIGTTELALEGMVLEIDVEAVVKN